VAGSSAFQTVRERRVQPGGTLEVRDYELTLQGVERRQGANAQEVRAVLAVSRDGEPLDQLKAGKNVYPVEQQTSSEVAIRSDLLTGEDLFVVADEIGADGSVYLKVFVKPLVNLIWLAGAVFILGSLVTLWPDAREQRRLAARYALPERLARA
jgi:cytochrome c-type biogenesis protein CcmF